ncbi:MAG TPA: hypothetical protein VG897_02655, partial [Terriglobales bacterium]|nr:hypothetical protein [Terriglobales bacterium]
MEFVTIHDLSRELNVPARVIRYRLAHAIVGGKMKENEDFRREDFKDELHFVWKINPLSFMQVTGLKPPKADEVIDNIHQATDNKPVNERPESVNEPIREAPAVESKADPFANKPEHVV